jgi:hypothetical protein
MVLQYWDQREELEKNPFSHIHPTVAKWQGLVLT